MFLEDAYQNYNHFVPTHTYSVSENIRFSTKAFLILLMSAFFTKNQRFLAKIIPLLKAIV